MEEKWRHRSLLDDRCRKNRDSPSFSSTLLDAIYRSIDEGGGQEEADKGLELYKQAMRKKQPQQHKHIDHNSKCSAAVRENAAAEAEEETEKGSLRRAILIEKWLQKKEVTSHATAAAAVDFEKTDAHRRRGSGRDEYSPLVHSSSSSSDSSCGGGFSSSEAESIHGVSDLHRALKPVRTRTSTTTTAAPIVSTRINGSESHRSYTHHDHHQKSATPPVRPKKNEGAFSKTKSKLPLKMLGDELKTAKQPISPGARLAGFLNSLLPAKKPKTTLPSSSLRNVNGDADANPVRKSKPPATRSAPACSSASSFSRSCLSLTPSARGKLGSARFGPASPSPVVDPDPPPRGHKKVYGIRPGFAAAVSKAARDSADANNHKLVKKHDAEDVLKACHRSLHHHHHQKSNNKDDDLRLSIKPESDLEDDVSSCSSLDLFELDHLSAIGMDRYREELPVD